VAVRGQNEWQVEDGSRSCGVATIARALLVPAAFLVALSGPVRFAAADITLPPPDPATRISVDADQAERWQLGAHEVWVLHGHCVVAQGLQRATASEAVLWIKRATDGEDAMNRVIAYFEGDVVVSDGAAPAQPGQPPTNGIEAQTWLNEFYSSTDVVVGVADPGPEPAVKSALYRKALARRNGTDDSQVKQAQYSLPGGLSTTTTAGTSGGSSNRAPVMVAQTVAPPVVGAPGGPQGMRRIQMFPRSRVRPNYQATNDPVRNESIIQIRQGVTVIINGLQTPGTIDISTDNMVLWTTGATSMNGETVQADNVPLEIYMEGNIVFRQGDRTIYAQRMYYDVRQQVGTVLSAEILSPAPQFAGLMRLRADVVTQTGPGRFVMQNTYATSSRLALPGYRLQAKNAVFEDNEVPLIDPVTNQPQIDPATGEAKTQHDRMITSRNNFLFVENVPVFYWPVIKNDVEQSNFYIRQARFKSDHIFGQQFLVDWDAYQVFGLKRLAGTDWTFSTDYFTARGPAVGTAYRWKGSELFGLNGPYNGFLDFWGIHDKGLDTLGSDRMNLLPEPDKEDRYKLLGRHRQYLANNFQFTGEVGLISDRNFLEQYFEREWDQAKDYDTDLMLKQYRGNSTWNVQTSARVNDWFTQTQWLPRLDHFWIGQDLIDERLTWYEHSSLGYANMRIAARPTDASEEAKFNWLPWEANVQGGRYFTTQEIDLPFEVAGVNVVPYGMGQLAHWDETLQGPANFRVPGDPMNRAWGQFGVRATLPFWAVNPNIQSTLFNVNGIAHKVLLDMDASWAGSNQDFTNLPLYDPIDDDNIEAFNRRFAVNTFNSSTVPAQWDPRYYALRYGLGNSVTSASPEILGNMTAIRLGIKQRWQTKRGLPGNQHVIDWITLNLSTALFPQANRDDFGSFVGLTTYDFAWHIGDRVTLVSDGIFDFFNQGQKIATVGGFVNRPPRGSLYFGFQSINGPNVANAFTPVNSEVVIGSYSYRMSEKWISSAGATIDVAHNGNIGEQFMLTRVGESFLMSVGGNVDASKKNYGLSVMVEPRFMPRTQTGRVGGAQIPLAGVNGLE
jgi:hypothetical protein